MHPSLTLDRIVRAVKCSMHTDGGQGFCIACGRKAKQWCEPDARGYLCAYKRCPSHTFPVGLNERLERSDGFGGSVYGTEELLLMVHS